VSRALVVLPEAREEFERAALWYAAIRPSLGAAFVDQVAAATSRALHAPLEGSSVGQLRRVLVRRFPCFVLYAVEEAQVIIVAVAHFRRRPDYWVRR
jgi:toxin ParE1/3/4